MFDDLKTCFRYLSLWGPYRKRLEDWIRLHDSIPGRAQQRRRGGGGGGEEEKRVARKNVVLPKSALQIKLPTRSSSPLQQAMSNSINRTLSRFFSQSYRTATTSRTRSSAIASQVTSKPSNHIRIRIPIPTSSQFRPSINRKFYSTSPCTPTAASPSLAKVPNRSILEFKGRDTLKLLQGLISNDVRIFEKGAAKYEENKGIYAVFLYPNVSAQGEGGGDEIGGAS